MVESLLLSVGAPDSPTKYAVDVDVILGIDTLPDNPVSIVGFVAITAILFLRMSMNEPANNSVGTKLPPAVAVPTFKSLLKTSFGTKIPFAGLSYFLEAASDTSLSKAASS